MRMLIYFTVQTRKFFSHSVDREVIKHFTMKSQSHFEVLSMSFLLDLFSLWDPALVPPPSSSIKLHVISSNLKQVV